MRVRFYDLAFGLIAALLLLVGGAMIARAGDGGVCGQTKQAVCAESMTHDGRLYVRIVNSAAFDMYCNISASNYAFYELIAYARKVTRWFVINDPTSSWQWSCGGGL